MSLVERVLILLYNWKGEDNATVIPPMKPIALNIASVSDIINNAYYICVSICIYIHIYTYIYMKLLLYRRTYTAIFIQSVVIDQKES